MKNVTFSIQFRQLFFFLKKKDDKNENQSKVDLNLERVQLGPGAIRFSRRRFTQHSPRSSIDMRRCVIDFYFFSQTTTISRPKNCLFVAVFFFVFQMRNQNRISLKILDCRKFDVCKKSKTDPKFYIQELKKIVTTFVVNEKLQICLKKCCFDFSSFASRSRGTVPR